MFCRGRSFRRATHKAERMRRRLWCGQYSVKAIDWVERRWKGNHFSFVVTIVHDYAANQKESEETDEASGRDGIRLPKWS